MNKKSDYRLPVSIMVTSIICLALMKFAGELSEPELVVSGMVICLIWYDLMTFSSRRTVKWHMSVPLAFAALSMYFVLNPILIATIAVFMTIRLVFEYINARLSFKYQFRVVDIEIKIMKRSRQRYAPLREYPWAVTAAGLYVDMYKIQESGSAPFEDIYDFLFQSEPYEVYELLKEFNVESKNLVTGDDFHPLRRARSGAIHLLSDKPYEFFDLAEEIRQARLSS